MTQSVAMSVEALFERYAQLSAEHMGLDDVMNHAKDSIVRALNDLPRNEALEEISESCWADELAGVLAIAESNDTSDTSELFDQYAQLSAEAIDTGDMENGVIESIEKRLNDLPLNDAIDEIQDSHHADDLAALIATVNASEHALAL